MSIRFDGIQKCQCKKCKKYTAIVSKHTATKSYKYCYNCDMLTIEINHDLIPVEIVHNALEL